MKQQRVCEVCGGSGYIEISAGLNALQERYPALPIQEMALRGWFGDVGDGEDVASCDRAFLTFWGVERHADVPVAPTRGPSRHLPGNLLFLVLS